MSDFASIQTQAKDKWDTLKSTPTPVIYLGSASCGLAAGIKAVEEKMKQAIESLDLNVKVVEVGCIGMCCYEPMTFS